MLRFLIDEDMRGPIINGLRLHYPDMDVLSADDVGLRRRADDVLLAWAASRDRVLVSHDENTMTSAAKRRIRAGHDMAGLIIVPQTLGVATAIEHLRFVAEVCWLTEMKDATIWLPL